MNDADTRYKLGKTISIGHIIQLLILGTGLIVGYGSLVATVRATQADEREHYERLVGDVGDLETRLRVVEAASVETAARLGSIDDHLQMIYRAIERP